jgi:hypothetical protein
LVDKPFNAAHKLWIKLDFIQNERRFILFKKEIRVLPDVIYVLMGVKSYMRNIGKTLLENSRFPNLPRSRYHNNFCVLCYKVQFTFKMSRQIHKKLPRILVMVLPEYTVILLSTSNCCCTLREKSARTMKNLLRIKNGKPVKASRFSMT